MLRRARPPPSSRLFFSTAAAPAPSFRATPDVNALLEDDLEHFGDPLLPTMLSRLRDRRADHCWHKHGTFKEHLLNTYRILALWKQPQALCRCGAYHSAYRNSYVNLALFDRGVDRATVAADLGDEAEDLVHTFCTIPRHGLLTQVLPELLGTGGGSQKSASSHAGGALPAEGIVTEHIHTGEPVRLSRPRLGQLLTFTIADVAEQYTGWYDELGGDRYWENDASVAAPWAVWPGPGRPGIWVARAAEWRRWAALCSSSSSSSSSSREEEEEKEEKEAEGEEAFTPPPVLVDDVGGRGGAAAVMTEADERLARDAYWGIIAMDPASLGTPGARAAAVDTLLHEVIRRNPYVGEPRITAAQLLLVDGEVEAAAAHAAAGLDLMSKWGTAWDKRVGWAGWMAWGRVLLQQATEDGGKAFPSEVMGVVNLGLVRE